MVDVGSCKLPSFQMCASPYAQDVPIPGRATRGDSVGLGFDGKGRACSVAEGFTQGGFGGPRWLAACGMRRRSGGCARPGRGPTHHESNR